MLKFFQCPLPPDELVTKLKTFVDEEEIDPGSRTHFSGDRPVVGRIDAGHFTLQRRVAIPWYFWWLTPGQWFKPHVNGTVTAEKESGSRIELTGGTPVLVKIFWVLVFLGATGLIALVAMFKFPYDINHDPARSAENFFTALVMLTVVPAIFVVLPIIGWLQTRLELADILKELQSNLDLRPVE
jgi:hypothetical protein